MILRFDKAEGFIIFDNVTQVERHTSDDVEVHKKYDHTYIIDDVGRKERRHDATRTEGVRIGFMQGSASWYVLSDLGVYVMNDNGKTIDRH